MWLGWAPACTLERNWSPGSITKMPRLVKRVFWEAGPSCGILAAVVYHPPAGYCSPCQRPIAGLTTGLWTLLGKRRRS